jgi:hypothetical protein
MAGALHGILADQFTTCFRTTPTGLILDFDSTDGGGEGQRRLVFRPGRSPGAGGHVIKTKRLSVFL